MEEFPDLVSRVFEVSSGPLAPPKLVGHRKYAGFLAGPRSRAEEPHAPTSALLTQVGAGKSPTPAFTSSNPLPHLGRRVILSVSLPSEETTLNFSVTLTTPVQPAELHERLPPAVTVGVPVVSDTTTVTGSP